MNIIDFTGKYLELLQKEKILPTDKTVGLLYYMTLKLEILKKEKNTNKEDLNTNNDYQNLIKIKESSPEAFQLLEYKQIIELFSCNSFSEEDLQELCSNCKYNDENSEIPDINVQKIINIKKSTGNEQINDEVDEVEYSINSAIEDLVKIYTNLINLQIASIQKDRCVGILGTKKILLLQENDNDYYKDLLRKYQTITEHLLKNEQKILQNGEKFYKIYFDENYKNTSIEQLKTYLKEQLSDQKTYFDNLNPLYKKLKAYVFEECRLCVVQDFVESTAILFKVFTDNSESSYVKLEDVQNFEFFEGSKLDSNKIMSKTLISNQNQKEYTYGFYTDQKAYESRPFFAHRLKQDFIESSKGDSFNPVIGKTYDNKALTIPFNAVQIDQRFVFLVAGSRSGKGVLTLCQLAIALSKNYKTFYLDCKPDMSKSLVSIGKKDKLPTFTVDGRPYMESSNLDLQINGKNYIEYAKEKLSPNIVNDLGDENVKALIPILSYTRAISDIVYLATKQSEEYNKPAEEKKYGTTPCFVVIDEIEQYAIVLKDYFYEGANKRRKELGGKIGKFANEGVNCSIETKNYIKAIYNYIETTWGKFGALAPSMLGQSLLKIFVICQHVTINGWCDPIANALQNYSGGATYILGNESDKGDGSKIYGCSEFKMDKYPIAGKESAGDYLGLGKFILRQKTKYTPFKSVFLLNSSCNEGTDYPSSFVGDMYSSIENESVRRLVNKELFNIDDASTFEALKNKPLTTTGKLIGFYEFTDFLKRKKGHTSTVAQALNEGYDYLSKTDLYKDSPTLWEKFYNFSYEGLGLKSDIDCSFIHKIKTYINDKKGNLLNDRYIVLYEDLNKYKINVPDYIKFLCENPNNKIDFENYTKQLTGLATEADFEANKQVIDHLAAKMDLYKPISIKEEKNLQQEIELNQYKEENPNATKEEIELQTEKIKKEIEDQYKDLENLDSSNTDEDDNTTTKTDDIRKTEYIKTLIEISSSKYNDLLGNNIIDIDEAKNQYIITKSEFLIKLQQPSFKSQLEIYNSQCANDTTIGSKNTKDDANEQIKTIWSLLENWLKEETKNQKNLEESDFEEEEEEITEQDTVVSKKVGKKEENNVKKDNGITELGPGKINGLQEFLGDTISLTNKKHNDVKMAKVKFQQNAGDFVNQCRNHFMKELTARVKRDNKGFNRILQAIITDQEICFDKNKYNIDQYLDDGLTISYLFDFNSQLFNSLTSLVTLELDIACINKYKNSIKSLWQERSNIISVAKHAFKKFKHLEKIIIYPYNKVITRENLPTATQGLADIENKIKRAEFEASMGQGMQNEAKKIKTDDVFPNLRKIGHDIINGGRGNVFNSMLESMVYGRDYSVQFSVPNLIKSAFVFPFILGANLFGALTSGLKFGQGRNGSRTGRGYGYGNRRNDYG